MNDEPEDEWPYEYGFHPWPIPAVSETPRYTDMDYPPPDIQQRIEAWGLFAFVRFHNSNGLSAGASQGRCAPEVPDRESGEVRGSGGKIVANSGTHK